MTILFEAFLYFNIHIFVKIMQFSWFYLLAGFKGHLYQRLSMYQYCLWSSGINWPSSLMFFTCQRVLGKCSRPTILYPWLYLINNKVLIRNFQFAEKLHLIPISTKFVQSSNIIFKCMWFCKMVVLKSSRVVDLGETKCIW